MRASAELHVGAALGDPEEELAVGARRGELARGPLRRPVRRLSQVVCRRAGREADVEAHRDVRAEPPLDLGGQLGREAGGLPVVDGAERHPVVVGGDDRVAEGEDLEPARVREDRPVPGHEPVQSAELADQLRAGPEVQVVRVAEQDRRAELAQADGVEGLDGRLRPDRHERRRGHVAVRRAEDAGARRALGSGHREAHDTIPRVSWLDPRATGAVFGVTVESGWWDGVPRIYKRASVTGGASHRRRSRSGTAPRSRAGRGAASPRRPRRP